MQFKKHAAGWLSAVLFVAASPEAHAILTSGNGTPLPMTPGVLGGALDGVGRISFAGGGYCSANLLSGGQYALTAAHCAGGTISEVSFQGGAVTRQVTQAFVSPGWNLGGIGATPFGADVAVLKLDQPIVNIQGYELIESDVTGGTVLMAGYGRTGNGNTGWNDPNLQGLGHYGYNKFDVSISSRRGSSLNGSLYGFDFDNGLLNQDTLCFLWGVCDLGLGLDESSVAFGDSGGGSFVWDGTQWRLAGVHSHSDEYMSQACGFDPAQVCGDVNGLIYDSSFGEVFWDVNVLSHSAWIDAIVSGLRVPEPGTSLLLAVGMVGVMLGSRRRSRQPS